MLERDSASVFPLFSPEGEKLWAPGWDYTHLLGSKDLHRDDVFVTDAHDHKSTRAIWIVSDYDPVKHYVSYYKIEPGEKIGKVIVECFRQTDTSTLVRVTYRYTGLSDSGNQFISGFTKEVYKEFIGEWRLLLLRYFEKHP